MNIYGFEFTTREVDTMRAITGWDKAPLDDFAAAVTRLEVANDLDRRVTPELRKAFALRLKRYMRFWPEVKRSGEKNVARFRELMHTFLPLRRESPLILPDQLN